MEHLKQTLQKAKEAHEKEPMSRTAYSYDSWALGTIKGMVSFWADENDFRGNKMKGHQLDQWKKEVFDRIKDLDKIFKEVK